MHRINHLAARLRSFFATAYHDNVLFLASALSFDALLAAIPFTLLFLWILGFVMNLDAGPGGDIRPLLHTLLPPHNTATADPLEQAERIISQVISSRSQLSVYAVPLFVLFSTRLFASVRCGLNQVLGTGRQLPYLRGLAKELILVLVTAVLLSANYLVTIPVFHISWFDRVLSHVLALALGGVLFFVVYSTAPDRPLRPVAALKAAIFASVAFETGKFLYAVYLEQFFTLNRLISHGNAIALLLFVFWIYYTALVLLLGGEVAKASGSPHLDTGLP